MAFILSLALIILRLGHSEFKECKLILFCKRFLRIHLSSIKDINLNNKDEFMFESGGRHKSLNGKPGIQVGMGAFRIWLLEI